MADGMIRPRPQPLARYGALKALSAARAVAAPVAVAAAVLVDVGRGDLVVTVARNIDTILRWGYLAAAAAPGILFAVAAGIVYRRWPR